jgi:hypothetical protein
MAVLWEFSAYQLCYETHDPRGRLYTTEYEPFTYEVLPDNIEHVVTEGDTWDSIAAKYWAPIFQAGALWRFIADFQPGPVVDPFITLKEGTIIVVPSRNTLFTKILDADRRLIVD